MTHRQCWDCYTGLCNVERCVREGHDVLIIMRGVPGSGKTHLAKRLASIRDDESSIILSTDNYFMINGEYKFDHTKLEEYHKKNIVAARDNMKNMDHRTIIIDNTNIQVEHFKSYIIHAVSYQYEIYIVEPDSDWKMKAGQCARKNLHGVTKEKIEYFLDLLCCEGRPQLRNLIPKDKQIEIGVVDTGSDPEEDESPIQMYVDANCSASTSKDLYPVGCKLGQKDLNLGPPPESNQKFPWSPSFSNDIGINVELEAEEQILDVESVTSKGVSDLKPFSLVAPKVHDVVKKSTRTVSVYCTPLSLALSSAGLWSNEDEAEVICNGEVCIPHSRQLVPNTNKDRVCYTSKEMGYEYDDLNLLVNLFPDTDQVLIGDQYSRSGNSLANTMSILHTIGCVMDLDIDYGPAGCLKQTYFPELLQSYESNTESREEKDKIAPKLSDFDFDAEKVPRYDAIVGRVDPRSQLFEVELSQDVMTLISSACSDSEEINPSGKILLPHFVIELMYLCAHRRYQEAREIYCAEHNLCEENNMEQLERDATLAKALHENEQFEAQERERKRLFDECVGSEQLALQELIRMFPCVQPTVIKDAFNSNYRKFTPTKDLLQIHVEANGLDQPPVTVAPDGFYRVPGGFDNSEPIGLRASSSQTFIVPSESPEPIERQEQFECTDPQQILRTEEAQRRFKRLHEEATQVWDELADMQKEVYSKQLEMMDLHSRFKQQAGGSYKHIETKQLKRDRMRVRDEMMEQLVALNEQSPYLDMHYLVPQRALALLRNRLRLLDRPESKRRGAGRSLLVISGWGKLNDGKSTLKNSIRQFLNNQGYKYSMDNIGTFRVEAK